MEKPKQIENYDLSNACAEAELYLRRIGIVQDAPEESEDEIEGDPEEGDNEAEEEFEPLSAETVIRYLTALARHDEHAQKLLTQITDITSKQPVNSLGSSNLN